MEPANPQQNARGAWRPGPPGLRALVCDDGVDVAPRSFGPPAAADPRRGTRDRRRAQLRRRLPRPTPNPLPTTSASADHLPRRDIAPSATRAFRSRLKRRQTAGRRQRTRNRWRPSQPVVVVACRRGGGGCCPGCAARTARRHRTHRRREAHLRQARHGLHLPQPRPPQARRTQAGAGERRAQVPPARAVP
jgi:hypothetical protein